MGRTGGCSWRLTVAALVAVALATAARSAQAGPKPPAAPQADGAAVPGADVAALAGVLTGLQFRVGAAHPTGPEVGSTIEQIARALTGAPGARIELDGYSDSRGDPVVNRSLSLRRARWVKRALVARGVAADRIDIAGRGADDPVADNHSAAGRATNRRVELRLVAGFAAGPAAAPATVAVATRPRVVWLPEPPPPDWSPLPRPRPALEWAAPALPSP